MLVCRERMCKTLYYGALTTSSPQTTLLLRRSVRRDSRDVYDLEIEKHRDPPLSQSSGDEHEPNCHILADLTFSFVSTAHSILNDPRHTGHSGRISKVPHSAGHSNGVNEICLPPYQPDPMWDTTWRLPSKNPTWPLEILDQPMAYLPQNRCITS